MTLKFYLLLLLSNAGVLFATVNPNDFYKALYSNTLDAVDAALKKLEASKSNTTYNAYKGALLMKKSGFLKSASDKVDTFKAGHELLEAVIKKYPQNVEYRFMRLTIQENAPKILKYNKDLEQDKALIIKEFKNLNSETRSFILDYAQQSKILKVEELKN